MEDNKKEIIDKDFLIEVYKSQWEDIHHNRTQDWEIARLILAGFLGLSGLKIFGKSPALNITVSIAFVIICLFGILVAVRHKDLFNEKMHAIKKLEKEMGIETLSLFNPNKEKIRLRTQNILIWTYTTWAVLFLIFAILELLK